MKIGTISLAEESRVEDEILDFDKISQTESENIIRFVDFSGKFPLDFCKTVASLRKTPIICWIPETGDNRRDIDPDSTGIIHILEGRYDEYIKRFALEIKKFSHPVMIDLLHEFNAGWYTWSGNKNGANLTATVKIKRVWNYVVEKFRELEVNNVKWIWTLHEDSFNVPLDSWNHISNYWPGEEWVDIVGIDGFNFYPENPERDYTPFLSFYDCFSKMYRDVQKLTSLPVMIMTGCSEFNYDGMISDKAKWITHMFRDLRENFPQVAYLNWFNYKYSDKIDWRLNSSEKTLNSWIRGVLNN